MPLTESFKRKIFGNTEPQQRRDYSAPGNALLYEAYAAPGVSEDDAGWVIIKHSYNGSGADSETQPKWPLIYTLRNIYNYDSP